MMDGKDMRACSAAMYPCSPVYFIDKDGGVHEVFSFKRVRGFDTGPVNLLMEIGAVVNDFGELRTEKPPQELIDYMNKKWEEQENG